MKILVINCGSSSIKYQLFEMDDESLLARGIVERIGEDTAAVTYAAGDGRLHYEAPIEDHEQALGHIRKALMDPDHGVITSPDDIDAAKAPAQNKPTSTAGISMFISMCGSTRSRRCSPASPPNVRRCCSHRV